MALGFLPLIALIALILWIIRWHQWDRPWREAILGAGLSLID